VRPVSDSQPSRDIVSRPTAAGLGESDLFPAESEPRLLAIVVGIDRYTSAAIPDLCCAVNDAESVACAILQTQSKDALCLTLLTDPPLESSEGRPARESILAAARALSIVTEEPDTLLFYFAGHGGMLDGRPCLFPSDARLDLTDAANPRLAGAISVDELQDVFRNCPCRRRVMFLDCCQNAFSAGASAQQWLATGDASPSRSLPWRTGVPLAGELVDAFQQAGRGWSLLLACGPNEVSLEDPQWGGHGIFSHFLATGLRGDADLDRDGVVSLPELVQYLSVRVPGQAEAVVDELRRRGGPAPTQQRQTPTVIWSGPIALPLTRCHSEQRAPWRARVATQWLHLLARPLPYPMAAQGMARYGTAGWYALAMGLLAALVMLRSGWEAPLVPAALIALISGLLWLANFALAAAANELRWHTGGYVAGILTSLWHALVFVVLAGLIRGHPQEVVELATGLFALLCVMIIFAHNALHCIIALADLVKRNLRVAGRRALMQLDRQGINADIDNMIAMVSAHPRVYLMVGLIVSVLAIAQAVYVLATTPLERGLSLYLALDFVLVTLVQWQVHWFAAAYRKLRGILLPER